MDEITVTLLEPGTSLPLVGDDIWNLLMLMDNEFVPPLSQRSAGRAQSVRTDKLWNAPIRYFEQLMSEKMLFARLRGKPIGFMAFIEHCNAEVLDTFRPAMFFGTIAIRNVPERAQIGRALAEKALEIASDTDPYMASRTWTGNSFHHETFDALGLEPFKVIMDDRGPGIGSVYCGRATPAYRGDTATITDLRDLRSPQQVVVEMNGDEPAPQDEWRSWQPGDGWPYRVASETA